MAKNDNIEIIGDKKVKVEQEHISKLRKFWKRVAEDIKQEGLLSYLKEKVGAIFKNPFSLFRRKRKAKKTDEQISEAQLEVEMDDIEFLYNKFYDEGLYQIRDNEKLSIEEQEELIKSCEETLNNIKEYYDMIKTTPKAEEYNAQIAEKISLMSEHLEKAKGMVEERKKALNAETVFPDAYITDIENDNKAEIEEQELVPDEEENFESREMPEKENMNLADLTEFENYDEYLRAYRKQNIDPENVDKFYIDFINGDLDIHKDLLTKAEFIDKRRQQTEKIRQDEQKQQITELNKELSEKRTQLETANEKISDLERQSKDVNARLEETRQEKISLDKSVADLEATIREREEEISRLNEQVHITSSNLKDAQDQLYNKENTIAEQLEAITKEKEKNRKLQEQLAERDSEQESLRKELENSNKKINELVTNVTSQIDSIKADDEVEETALKYVKKIANEDQNSDDEKTDEQTAESQSKPKHFKEPDEPQPEAEMDERRQGILDLKASPEEKANLLKLYNEVYPQNSDTPSKSR